MQNDNEAMEIMHVMASFDAAEIIFRAFRTQSPADPTVAARGCLFAAGAIMAKAGFDVDDGLIVNAVRGIQNKALDQLAGKAQHNHPVPAKVNSPALHFVGGTDFENDELDRQLLDRDFDDEGNDRGPIVA